MLREIPGPAGVLEAVVDEPADRPGVNRAGLVEQGRGAALRAAVVLAHPHPQYGGTMHTKAVYQAAKALARIGCAVLRFNFRGVGRSAGTFDMGEGEKADFRAALDFARERYPDVPLWAGGMSFGSWVALTAGAEDPGVAALIGISMPVDRYDFEVVRTSPKPKFFIHGERDELFPLKRVREFYARAAEPKELVVVDAADHVFDGKTTEVADAIEDLLGDWQPSRGAGRGAE
jgi:alpha/beta superfamily hydrolase